MISLCMDLALDRAEIQIWVHELVFAYRLLPLMPFKCAELISLGLCTCCEDRENWLSSLGARCEIEKPDGHKLRMIPNAWVILDLWTWTSSRVGETMPPKPFVISQRSPAEVERDLTDGSSTYKCVPLTSLVFTFCSVLFCERNLWVCTALLISSWCCCYFLGLWTPLLHARVSYLEFLISVCTKLAIFVDYLFHTSQCIL